MTRVLQKLHLTPLSLEAKYDLDAVEYASKCKNRELWWEKARAKQSEEQLEEIQQKSRSKTNFAVSYP